MQSSLLRIYSSTRPAVPHRARRAAVCDPGICLLVIRLQLAADTPTMRYGLLAGAFVVVALLMAMGMRQRWIPGPRGGWEPGARGRWEPCAGGQWEPRPDLDVPEPRIQWQLAVIGWCLLLTGMLLALLLRNQVIGFIAVTAYAATWFARIILLDWSHATGPLPRVLAVARPLAFAGGIVLGAMTRSIWWFAVGAVLFVAIPVATGVIQSRRNRRAREQSSSQDNDNDEAPRE
jgi:hypothetical protein